MAEIPTDSAISEASSARENERKICFSNDNNLEFPEIKNPKAIAYQRPLSRTLLPDSQQPFVQRWEQ